MVDELAPPITAESNAPEPRDGIGIAFSGGGYRAIGHVLTIARTGRIDTLSGGLCKSDDFDAIKVHRARFMAAGLRAICQGCEAPGGE